MLKMWVTSADDPLSSLMGNDWDSCEGRTRQHWGRSRSNRWRIRRVGCFRSSVPTAELRVHDSGDDDSHRGNHESTTGVRDGVNRSLGVAHETRSLVDSATAS